MIKNEYKFVKREGAELFVWSFKLQGDMVRIQDCNGEVEYVPLKLVPKIWESMKRDNWSPLED